MLLQICTSGNKRNFCNVSGIYVTGEPVRRSRRLTKKSVSDTHVDCVILDDHLRESHSPLKENIPVCADLENSSSMIVPSTQELTTGIVALDTNEGIEEQNNFHISLSSNSSRNCALSGPGTSQLEHYEHIQTKADFFDVGDNQNEERSRNDEPGKASCLDSNTRLSCVICWTDFSSTRGVLSCGHRFCYSCIQQWADCMVCIFLYFSLFSVALFHSRILDQDRLFFSVTRHFTLIILYVVFTIYIFES